MTFARKIYKIPEFHMIFARKMPEFYVMIAKKIFFTNFRGARAPPPPLQPVAYAYEQSFVLVLVVDVRFSKITK